MQIFYTKYELKLYPIRFKITLESIFSGKKKIFQFFSVYFFGSQQRGKLRERMGGQQPNVVVYKTPSFYLKPNFETDVRLDSNKSKKVAKKWPLKK